MMERWLNSHDVAGLLGYVDLRAARERMKELGGRKVGGQWRLASEALDQLRGPSRINERPMADHSWGETSTSPARRVRDPRPRKRREPGWWRKDDDAAN